LLLGFQQHQADLSLQLCLQNPVFQDLLLDQLLPRLLQDQAGQQVRPLLIPLEFQRVLLLQSSLTVQGLLLPQQGQTSRKPLPLQ